jgi:hypothetical protein
MVEALVEKEMHYSTRSINYRGMKLLSFFMRLKYSLKVKFLGSLILIKIRQLR